LRTEWDGTIASVFQQAHLEIPKVDFPQAGGREGRHGEEMGHILSDLQYVQRTHPGLTW